MRSPNRIAFLPLLLSLTLATLACQSEEDKLAGHKSRGDAYMEEEKWSEAVIEYKNVLQIDPQDAEAHWGLAQAYLNLKQARDGFWELRETVRLDPGNLDAKLAFSQMAIVAGELEEALKQTDEVLIADPQKIEAYVVKAQALEALKRQDEVLEILEAGLEIDPESDAVLVLLADLHRRQGNRAAAEPLFRKRVDLDPSYRTWTALASFLGEERDRESEAEEAWIQARDLAEETNWGRAHAQLANFYFRADRFDEAKGVLEQGIEQGGPDKLDLIYLLARFHAIRGEEELADQLIEKATEAEPDNPRPYLILSTYKGRKGDVQGALAAAEDAVRVAPDSQAARLRKAEVLVELGYREKDEARIAEGRRIAEEILAEEPTNPGALFVKAKIEMAEQQVDAAITTLRAAIDARPEWAQAHFILGTALTVKGERVAARTELRRALEIDAGLTEAHQVLAQVYSQLGEHEYAVEEGRLYLRAKPDATPMRVLVAQSLVRLGRLQDALTELRLVPEEERGPEVHYAIARVLLFENDFDGARAEVEAAHAQKPESVDILRTLLQLDRRQGRLAESVARIDAAIEQNPDDPNLRRLYGQVLMSSGKAEEAEKAFQRAIELDPKDVESYEMLARYYAATRRIPETIAAYEKAVEADPNASQIHHFLGVLYESSGQRQKAVDAYEAAIRVDPNLAEAKNNLAYLFADSGEKGENLDRALDLAQEAKALLPDNPNAADTLGWVLYKRGVAGAAINYLREAESGFEPGEPSLCVVRHHLALAYQANGQGGEAKKTLEAALADYEAIRERMRANGRPPSEDPPCVADVRSLLQEL